MKGPELEQLLVGAVLASDEPLRLLQASQLHPESISDPILRVAWDLAWSLARKGQRVDANALCVAGVVAKRMRLDDLAHLQALEARNTLTAQSFIQVAGEFRRHAQAQLLGKQLVDLGKELIGASTSPQQAHARFTAIAENYSRLHAEVRRGSTAVVAALETWERRRREEKPPLTTTGIHLLDEQTGGLPPKLGVIVGKPGIGKSALLAAMIEQQLRAQLSVLFFSLEDRDEWFIRRHMAKRLGIKAREVEAHPDDERKASAAHELGELSHNLYFVTKDQARTTADVVRISVQCIAQYGVQVIWLDNATALKHIPANKWDEPRMAAGRMYEAFAELADKFRVPFIALAHTTRKYEERTKGGRGPPALSDIAETADAERAVRLGLGLWSRRNQTRVTVLKNTEGPAGMTLELGMNTDAAIIDPDKAELVNLHEEARKEREERQDRSDEANVARAARRKELKDKLQAQKKAEEAAAAAKEAREKEAEAPPQLELLPGGKEPTP